MFATFLSLHAPHALQTSVASITVRSTITSNHFSFAAWLIIRLISCFIRVLSVSLFWIQNRPFLTAVDVHCAGSWLTSKFFLSITLSTAAILHRRLRLCRSATQLFAFQAFFLHHHVRHLCCGPSASGLSVLDPGPSSGTSMALMNQPEISCMKSAFLLFATIRSGVWLPPVVTRLRASLS